MGCMYGWVAYVGPGVAGGAFVSAALPAFAAADGHVVAGRVPALAAAISAAAASDHGVAMCAPTSAAAIAAAAAAAANPGGAVCENLEFSADAVLCTASLRCDVPP